MPSDYFRSDPPIANSGEAEPPYKVAIWFAFGQGDALARNWPNSNAEYQKNLDSIMKESDLIPFIIGYPYYLRGSYQETPKTNIVPSMSEQTVPEYTTLVAYTFGVKARVAGAIYPSGMHWHGEPAFHLRGEWFSFYGWGDYTEFKKDYIDKPASPQLEITGTDGRFAPVNLG
ncbi:MAG: hypothetical protein RMJ07_04270 [Nitrososphaerota archaeon]|nr:hypothetical protein [Candidatus Bathyarchaeota archaeon]MDW8048878.1 hypothetical protein [Nitrososphaerota archaeon]